jgi:anaerobic ribonucleoside-triphosphate reductase
MKNVRALKLDEEAFKDEQKILWSLKNELEEEFGFCLWDKMMKSKQMDLEELYDFYCKEKMRRKGLDV